MILMIAHWNWMDPAIANLQPVLNSYWLMIHVAVIVASYGPFTLGMILGIVSLLLMLLTTAKNKKKMELNIREITIINEMALTVGLVDVNDWKLPWRTMGQMKAGGVTGAGIRKKPGR